MKYLAGLTIKESQFEALRALRPADPEFPRTWDEWNALVAKADAEAEQEGLRATEIPLDIDHFLAWCKMIGIVPCLDALRAYAIVMRAILDGGKSQRA